MSGAFLRPSRLVLGHLVAHEAPVFTRVMLVARQTTAYPSLSTTFTLKWSLAGGNGGIMYTVNYPADGARRTFLTNVCLFSLKQSECIFEDASIHG